MTSWNLLPWQLQAASNVVNTADSAVTTHASSSYYHLNINYNQTQETVQLDFLPPNKQVEKIIKKKNKSCFKAKNNNNMYKPITPLNDKSNKSIQVPSVTRKSNLKERKHRRKGEHPKSGEHPVITNSINTNLVFDNTQRDQKSKGDKSDKYKKHHRHRRERSRETLVTITDTVSREHSKNQAKNRSKEHKHHSEPSQTVTVSENVSREICKDKTIIYKDGTKKHNHKRECSEDTITITGTFSKSNSNNQIKDRVKPENKEEICTKHKKKSKNNQENKEAIDIKQQQQLQDIIANFETVSGKNAQIYYIHSVSEKDPELAPVLKAENKDSSKKHIYHKRKRKHHLSRETKCEDVQHTTSSSSAKCKSQENLPVKNKKEGIKFFFVKNKKNAETDKKTSCSKGSKKSGEHGRHKHERKETKPSDNSLIVKNSRNEVCASSKNRSQSVDSKTFKTHVNRDSVEMIHCVGDGGVVKLNKTLRCLSQDQNGNKLEAQHVYNKRRSRSETNLKHIDKDKNDLVGDQKHRSSKKSSSKDKEKHHKKHHKVESTDVEVQKKKVEGNSVIEKIFFKRNILKNKSKHIDEEHRTKNESENQSKTHDNVNSTNSTEVRNSREFDKIQEHCKKRKRSKKTVQSEDKKSSKHKLIESTETGDAVVHKDHKKSRKSSDRHRKNTTTEDMSPKSSEEIQKKHFPGSSTESKELHRKSKRRKEKERHSHKHIKDVPKSVDNTSKSTVQERTDNSEVIYQLTTEKNYFNSITEENITLNNENKKIIKISKQQLEAIINQINKKHNLQQSKTLHYKLPCNDEKTEAKQMRKEVSFSHLNLKPVVAYYASPATNLNSFNSKQFDCMSTYNSILSFPVKDKRQAKPKRKTKIPDHKSVVSEAITKKEKFQYVCGRRYSTNRAARNFAYSENIFERSRKALRENGSSTVGFTVEGIEPPKMLKPDIVPSCLVQQKELTVAIVTGIDIPPKYERGKEITRSLSLLNKAADEDFTDGRGLSDASEKPQSIPNAQTLTSLLSMPSESHQSSSSPLRSRKHDNNQETGTDKDFFQGIHKFFEKDKLDKDQLAALGQEVFNRMMLHLKEMVQLSKEEKIIRPSRSPVKKEQINEKLRPPSRGSSCSSKRSISSSKDAFQKKTLTKSSFNEINKFATKDNSLDKTKSNSSQLNNKRSVSQNSSVNSASPRPASPKRHVNTPVRDRSSSLSTRKPSPSPTENFKNKDISNKSIPVPRRNSSVRSSSPKKLTNTSTDEVLNKKRSTSEGRSISPEIKSKVPVPTKSRDTSNESISSKLFTTKHISLYDRAKMQFRRKSFRSTKDNSSFERKSLESNEKVTKIPIRIISKDSRRKSANSNRLPSEKEASLERMDIYSKRAVSSDRRQRTRSSGSTSSEFSPINKDKLQPKGIVDKTKINKPKRTRGLQKSETFLCDSLDLTTADILNKEGKPGEGTKPLAKITEEASTQNLLEKLHNKDKWSLKQDGHSKVSENEIEEHLKNLSNEIFESILKMLNSESTIKRRLLYENNIRSNVKPKTNMVSKDVLNMKTYHESEALRNRETQNIPEKDELFTNQIPKEIEDQPPEIKCSSCSINVPRNPFDSDAESGIGKYSDKEAEDLKKNPNMTKQPQDNSLGKSKIPLRKEEETNKWEKITELKEEEQLKPELGKVKEKRASSAKRLPEKPDKPQKKKDEEPKIACNQKTCNPVYCNSTANEEGKKSEIVTGAGEQLDGKEIQHFSNLVKQNVIKELGAANLLKPYILEEKPKQGQQLNDIIERSIATALNQRVYSVMHSIAMNEDVFKTEDTLQKKEEMKNSQQHTSGSLKNSITKPLSQDLISQNDGNKKDVMLKKLTAMLTKDPDFLGLESRLDNILGIQQEKKSQIVNIASVPSKNVFNYKKANQIAYTVPAKRCKIRKSRLKINAINEKKNIDITKSNKSKTRILKQPKSEGNAFKLTTTSESLNKNKNNNSKIPTLIKPASIKNVSKFLNSDSSGSNNSKVKNISSSAIEENIPNQSTANFEEPNSARFLTKLLDIEIVDHPENQIHASSSKLINIPSKAKTLTSMNTKTGRPLSAYEKRKLYGEQLRFKKLNSKNEPALTSSTEHEKSNEDCIYCYPKNVRGVSTDLQFQKRPQESPSRLPLPKYSSRPEVSQPHSYNNYRSHGMMGAHQESEAELPTLGCFLCTKLHCDNPKILPFPSNTRRPNKYSSPAKPTRSCKDFKRKPPRDENIYHAYSVVANYPNVTDVFRNKFKTGSSISLFSRESMFSCDNILPCISPRSVASNCSLNTFHSKILYNTKSSSLLNTKYSNGMYEESKRTKRIARASRIGKRNYDNKAFCSPSKEFFNTIEQNSKNSFADRKNISTNSQLNLTPSYEFCHSTPEYVQNVKERIPFYTRSTGISRRKGNLLETCQHLRQKSLNDHSNNDSNSTSTSQDRNKKGKIKPLVKNKYQDVNRKTFFKDTKSLIYQSLERTSKNLDRKSNRLPPYCNQQWYRENTNSEYDLTEPYIEVSSVNNIFEGHEHTSHDENNKIKKPKYVQKASGVKTTKYNNHDQNRDTNKHLKRRRYNKFKISYNDEDVEEDEERLKKSVFDKQNYEDIEDIEDIEDTPSSAKEEDESYTIFKLDKDFQIQRKRKKHLDKNQSEECFKIFAYNNIIELDMDYPPIYSTCKKTKPFLFNNLKKPHQYKKARLKREQFCNHPDTPTSEKTESGYGSSKSRKSRSLRKFFPQQESVLDTFTAFRCFDQEVYVGKLNPLSRVTTFPVNTGAYSKTGRKPKNRNDYERQKQRRPLFEDSTPTSDCSDFSNEPYKYNQSPSKFRNNRCERHDRPISHLYNIELEERKAHYSRQQDPGRKLCTTEYDQRSSVNFEIDMEQSFPSNQHKLNCYFDESKTNKFSNKQYRSKIPQKLKPASKHHRNELEEVEEQFPFVCEKHKPLLYLRQKLLSKSYMLREYHNIDSLNVEEEHTSSNSNYRHEPPPTKQKPYRSHKYKKHDDFEPFSKVWQADSSESLEETREVLHKKDDTCQYDYKEPVHRTGGRFKELIRSISKPFTKRSNEGGLDDQCSAYTTSTKDSEPNQTYFWPKNYKNNKNVTSKLSETSLKGNSETRCNKTKNFKRLQKQVDQCHEYANKVCTESRLRQEGHLKQFVDFKEIPLSILLGKKNSQATGSINSSNRCHRSKNFPPKLKVLDDTQRSTEVLTLKNVCEDKVPNYKYKKVYFNDESVDTLKKNKKYGVYNKETCKALRDLLEHTECTKKACESLRNCFKKPECTKETYSDMKNALKESDCSEETCKNLRKLLKELRETFLEGTEGTSVNLKNVSKESIIPLKELLGMGFQKLLDVPLENEPSNEVSTELMRIPSGTTSSRTSSQQSMKELLDLPYDESTTGTLSQDSVVPLKELLDRVFDELLSTASKNSNVSSKISTHFIKSPLKDPSYVSIEKPSEFSNSQSTVASHFTDSGNLPCIKLTRSPGKTSLKHLSGMESSDNTIKKRLSIEPSSASVKEVQTQPMTSPVDQLLKELSQKTTEKLFETFKENLDAQDVSKAPLKESLTELYPKDTQSAFKHLKKLSKESKEFLQITIQKVLSCSKENLEKLSKEIGTTLPTDASSIKEPLQFSPSKGNTLTSRSSIHAASNDSPLINQKTSSKSIKCLSKDSKEILEDIFQKLLTLSKEPVGVPLKKLIALPADVSLINPGKHFLTDISELSLSEYSGTSSDLKPFPEDFKSKEGQLYTTPRKTELPLKTKQVSNESMYLEAKEEQCKQKLKHSSPTETLLEELIQYYVEVPSNPPFEDCSTCKIPPPKGNGKSSKDVPTEGGKSSTEEISLKKSFERLCKESPKESLMCACKYLKNVLKEPLSMAPKEAIIQILKSLAENLSEESKADLYPNIQNLFKENELDKTDLSEKKPQQQFVDDPLKCLECAEEPLDLSIKETLFTDVDDDEIPEPLQCTNETCSHRNKYHKLIPKKESIQSLSDTSFKASTPCSSKIKNEPTLSPKGCTKSTCKGLAKKSVGVGSAKYSSESLREKSKEALEEVFQKLINLSEEAISSKEMLEDVLSEETGESKEKEISTEKPSQDTSVGGCTKTTCKRLKRPSKESPGTSAKELPLHVINPESHTSLEDNSQDFIEASSSLPLSSEEPIKKASVDDLKSESEDFVQASPDFPSEGCTKATCKKLNRPTMESVGTSPKEDSINDVKSASVKTTSQDFVEAFPDPPVLECTKTTCKKLKQPLMESVGTSPKEDSVNEVKPELESIEAASQDFVDASADPPMLGCTNTTCKNRKQLSKESIGISTKEASVDDLVSETIQQSLQDLSETRLLFRESLDASTKEKSAILEVPLDTEPQLETKTAPLQCSKSTCTSLNYVSEKTSASPSTKETSAQVEQSNSNSPPRSLSQKSKDLLEEAFRKLSTEPSKEMLEETVAKLINLSKEIITPEEETEISAECTNSTCKFYPKTKIDKSETVSEDKASPSTKTPCECPEMVSKASDDLSAEEELKKDVLEISSINSKDAPSKQSSKSSTITAPPKEQPLQRTTSSCNILKDLPKGSRESLQSLVSTSRKSSKKSLSVVPEEPPNFSEEERLPETSQTISDTTHKEASPKCTCSDLIVSKKSSKSSFQSSTKDLNETASGNSNDLSVVIEGTLAESSEKESVEEESKKSEESIELQNSEQSLHEQPKETLEVKKDDSETKLVCVCGDLISFAEESRELLDIPLQNSATIPEKLRNDPFQMPQEESLLDKPLSQCHCPDFATQSQESIELSNTIFQNLVKSSEQCMSLQINERPHVMESFSETAKEQSKDSILFSKRNFQSLTGFPKRTELLMTLHSILDKNPMSGGVSSKKDSKKSLYGKKRDEKLAQPESSSEVPEELFHQLCDVSLKTMMELYAKVADNKEMKMSFKTMVEELCKNKLKEEKLSGNATQSQINVLELLKHYKSDKGSIIPNLIQAEDCICSPSKEKSRVSSKKDKPPPVIQKKIESKSSKKIEKEEKVSQASSITTLKTDAGISLRSEKGVTDFNSLSGKSEQEVQKSALKALRDSLTDKELFEKLLDSYEKEENIVERLSNDDEFFQSQLELVNSKESVATLLQAREDMAQKSEELLLAALNLESSTDLLDLKDSKEKKKYSVVSRNTESTGTIQKRNSKSKISGFTSKVARLFKTEGSLKEIVAPRVDGHKFSVDVSYLGKRSGSCTEMDEEVELVHKSISEDDVDEYQKVTFTGEKEPFHEEKKLFEDDNKSLLSETSKKANKRKSSIDSSDSNIVQPSELGKCFLRGFRSDYVSLGGDTCLLIANQEKLRELQKGKQESYIEFSERDTPLEYLLALGFSIDEASNAIKDEDVKNRLFAAITEARIWINQISTVQGTLLYVIAYKAKPRIMRYYLQLVEAIINRRIQNAVKLDAFLRVLEKVEDGDLNMINIIGSDKFDDEENEEKIVKKQLRQLFINVYQTAEKEANLKNKPLSKQAIILLRILAAKYRAGLHPHLELIARYIGQGLLHSEVQLEAAMIYLSRLDTADVDLEEFEQYCGIVCKEKKTPVNTTNPS